MFEERLAEVSGDRHALADLAAEIEEQLRILGCQKLMIAAAWADAHSEVDHPDGDLLVERLVSMGPAGTPAVAETAPAGLVGPFHTSRFSVQSWIGDALTIRHRLPRLWDRVQAGEVYAWQAREIAKQTSDLSVATAGAADADVTPWVSQLPWRSLLRGLEATIAQVDEAAYQRREQVAAAKREVRATQSEAGLRTLIARGEAGDVAMMLALYQRVAECLAEEGDEDPLPVRMSKAIGWVANPARLNDLLGRHADDADPHTEPWEQVAAHEQDPTDPWADDLPAAGWETDKQGNYYQPGFDESDWWDTPRDDEHEHVDWPTDPPVDDEDLAWFHDQHDEGKHSDQQDHCDQHDHPDHAQADTPTDAEPAAPSSGEPAASPGGADGAEPPEGSGLEDTASAPADCDHPASRAAGDSDGSSTDDHESSEPAETVDQHETDQSAPDGAKPQQKARVCTCGADTGPKTTQRWPTAFRPQGWQPLTAAQLATCAPTVILHVHLTDQTLRDNHGVVRTDAGPILVEQLKRFLVQHDAQIKVYPVIDPAETASADAYEIPLRLRRAMHIRNPRSVFPHSPTMSRLDLDHMPAYRKDGPPGQTAMSTLGPLARGEHRTVTVGKWQRRQPTPGVYLWRSPEQWVMITTNQGTLDLGHTHFAHQLWDSAA